MSSFACETCGGDTLVKDSRPGRSVYSRPTVRRRRLCLTCSKRFTTFELSESTIESMRDPTLSLKDRLALRTWLNRFDDMQAEPT